MIFEDHVQWPAKDIKIKNGKETLAKEDQLKALEEMLNKITGGKWPVTVKFHPSKVKKIADSEQPSGFRIEQPPAANITLEWTAINPFDKTPHVYTYCDYYVKDPKTKLNKYTPTIKVFDGGVHVFSENEKELLLFMFLAFPNLEGGLNETRSPNILVFDLPHKDKQRAAEYDALLTQVLVQINDRKNGLSMDQLRNALTAYFVPGVEKLEDYEVIAAMKAKATAGINQKEQMENMQLFLDRCSNKEIMRARLICQKAIDAGYLLFDSRRKCWNEIQDGRPVDPPICIVKPDELGRKEQVLYEVMSSMHQRLLDVLEKSLDLGDDEPEVETKKPGRRPKQTEEE